VARLLIVDDDPDVCEMVRLAVGDRYDVVAETNGARAVARLVEIEPEVVVVDLVMPGMDGLTVCERIKAARPDVLVVIVTATTCGSDLPDAFWRLGTPADAFLSKPFDPQLLVAKIHELKVKRIEAKRQAEKPTPGPLPPLAQNDDPRDPTA
jgi:CheY-like chemotaxis protein